MTAPDIAPVETPLVAAGERRAARTVRPDRDGRRPPGLGQPPLSASGPRRFITIEGGEGAGKSTQVGPADRRPGAGRASRPSAPASPAARRRRGDPPAAARRRHRALGRGLRGAAALRRPARSCDAADPAGAGRAAHGSSPTASPIRPSPIRDTAAGCRSSDLAALHRIALGDFVPDLTLILDLPVEVGLGRAPAGDRVPTASSSWSRVSSSGCATAFWRIAKADPGRCVVIDARLSRRRFRRRTRRGRAAPWGEADCHAGPSRDDEATIGPGPPPRANPDLVGHEDAGSDVCAGCSNPAACRMPGCSSGPRGIGKATLAYRFARFVLAAGRGRAPFGAVRRRRRRASRCAPESGVFRRVAAGGHADLLTLERAYDPRRRRLRSEIVVDDAREIAAFLRLTAGGRRLAHRRRRRRRRDEPQCRERAAEGPRGAAAQALLLLVSAQPGAAAADDPLALPAASAGAAAGATVTPSSLARYRPDLPRSRGRGAGGAVRAAASAARSSLPPPAVLELHAPCRSCSPGCRRSIAGCTPSPTSLPAAEAGGYACRAVR